MKNVESEIQDILRRLKLLRKEEKRCIQKAREAANEQRKLERRLAKLL